MSFDLPIKEAKSDELDRINFVKRICQALIDIENEKSTGVTVGITGQWGSGKSSVLNLIQEQIETTYPNAIVVRFDPWLVSGRDNLILQFFIQLTAAIKEGPSPTEELTAAAEKIAKYGNHLSPAANYLIPGLGMLFKGSFNAIEEALKKDQSLGNAREELMIALEKTSTPIIVLIDELDRVEDEEIRTVAQLVRSVVDFPQISYVLAYDERRVVEALGWSSGSKPPSERGRAYLEKIVQFQVPLPVTFEREVCKLILAELDASGVTEHFPTAWRDQERFLRVLEILVPKIIGTPRDVKRLVGTFSVLERMVRHEVDWVDLLAFCALLTKAPSIVERIRSDPDMLVENPISLSGSTALYRREQENLSERLKRFNPGEASIQIDELLGFMFPSLSQGPRRLFVTSDSIQFRRPLLTLLRLGLFPGTFSKDEAVTLLHSDRNTIACSFRYAYDEDTFEQLLDRLSEVYPNEPDAKHNDFWLGASDFLKKDDGAWISKLSPMMEVSRSLASLFRESVANSSGLEFLALQIFDSLLKNDDINLTSHLIRFHIHEYGLFGRKKQNKNEDGFLSINQAESYANQLSKQYRTLFLDGELLEKVWSLIPIYTMVDAGFWDSVCAEQMVEIIQDAKALDAVTLMLYGGVYNTEREVIQKILPLDSYLAALEKRINQSEFDSLHPSIQSALIKARKGE